MEGGTDNDKPAKVDAGLRRRQTISRCPHPRRASHIARVVVAALCSLWTVQGIAQELTPRTYWPAPKGIKVAVFGYVYAEGDVLFDPSIPLYGVDSRVNVAVAAYLQTFSLWGRTANVLVELPYQWSTTWGILVDTPARGSVSGFGDPAATLTLNLLGAPAMTPADIQRLRSRPRPILGTSLKIVAPFGKYDPNRLLNTGGNRWAVKAELGCIIPLHPKWLVEIEGGIWLLGDDDDFIAGKREQDPIIGTELHLVRRFKPGFWLAFDLNYFTGGRQTIAGNDLIDVQQNSRIGATLVVPFKGRNAIKLGYATGVFTEFGTDFDQYMVTYQRLFR